MKPSFHAREGKKRDPQQSFPLLMKALSKQVKYKRKSKYGVDSVTDKLSWRGWKHG